MRACAIKVLHIHTLTHTHTLYFKTMGHHSFSRHATPIHTHRGGGDGVDGGGGSSTGTG